MANRNRANKLVVPSSASILTQLRNEIAAELGYPDYDKMDRGEIPARVHGAIGGAITKKLIQLGEQSLLNGLAQSAMPNQEEIKQWKSEMEQSLQ